MTETTHKRLLLLILVLGLALRLIFGLAQDPNQPYADRGGDSWWYLNSAYTIVTDTPIRPPATDGAHLTPPPFYFYFIGIPQVVLSPSASVIAIRVLQAILSTATCYFAYRLAVLLTGREKAGLIAAFVLAFSPVFIIEAAQILTETVYIFLITGGIWLYIESVVRNRAEPQANGREWALLLTAAVLLGLATLTRAVLLLFPLGLAIHLLLVYGWRAGLKRAALFLLIYALVVSTWTFYSLARWNRFVIAGDGLTAFLYIGAAGWSGPQGTDQQLAEVSPDMNYTEGAIATIGKDPLGWIRRRVGELAGAYLQPHGTTFFSGASLRELALDWAREDRTPAGLIALTQGDSFWAKLTLYLLHFTALIAGAVGMWRYRRQWRVALPMIGLIAYVTLVHLALLALPRYLFPTEVFWWVFAAAALSDLFTRRSRVNATMG